MNRILLLLPFLLLPVALTYAQYNVIEFGAVPDGKTLNTQSIQSAIDSCHSLGGGTVYFPAGNYLSGTIILRSHVTLHLENGAVLIGSTNLRNFPAKIPALRSYTDNYTERSLIYAEKANNIAITGYGEIYGQGEKFEKKYTPYKIRPYMIRMIECQDITIRNITLTNSPMWVQHYLACENLLIDGISVKSRYSNLNNDGIDIDACRNVRITNSHINCEDDAIVLKSTLPVACENIVIDNCLITSLCNGFKCGTESIGGFRNIVFTNSTIYNTRLSAIALEVVDGGVMENVVIDNIIIDKTMNPFFIRLGNRRRTHADDYEPGMGSLSNVFISNVIARNIGGFEMDEKDHKDLPDRNIPSSISGIPGNPVKNIFFTNVIMELPGGGNQDHLQDSIPELENQYPEYKMFGTLPAGAIYIRHAEDVIFNQVNVSYKNPEARPAFYLDDADNIEFYRVNTGEHKQYLLKNGSNITP